MVQIKFWECIKLRFSIVLTFKSEGEGGKRGGFRIKDLISLHLRNALGLFIVAGMLNVRLALKSTQTNGTLKTAHLLSNTLHSGIFLLHVLL